jgi:hypothetical protein
VLNREQLTELLLYLEKTERWKCLWDEINEIEEQDTPESFDGEINLKDDEINEALINGDTDANTEKGSGKGSH